MAVPRPNSREMLIQTALAVFGARGRDGATTRDIAAAAGMPMSQITYHFGGKDGLYLACAQHIADHLGGRMAPALSAIDARFDGDDSPASARAMLHDLFGQIVPVMLSPATAPFVRFIMREQTEPSEAFALIYGGVMGQMLARIAYLIGVISGPHGDPGMAQVRALSLIGQVVVFRVAQAAVLRATGWDAVGEAELATIRVIILSNIDAICDRLGQVHTTGDNL